MRVYIGGPIDTARSSPREQFEELAGWVLDGLGPNTVIYNPLTAFVNAGVSQHADDLDFLIKINNHVLREVDLGVFVWNGSPSYGVPLEIKYLVDEEALVVILNTTGRLLGAYLRALAAKKQVVIVDSSEDLVRWLRQSRNLERMLSEDDGEIG